MDEKKTFLFIELGIILVVITLLFCPKEESIIVYYDQYPDNMGTKIFYDTGSGYLEEFSSASNADYKTQIIIPKEYIPSLKQIRIDFSDKEGMLSIRKMAICKNGINILSLNAEEIVELFDNTDELEYSIENNRLIINNLTIDGKCYFNSEFVKKVKDIYNLIQPMELMIGFFIVSVITLLFHFRNKIYIWGCALSRRRRFAFILFLFTTGVLWCYRRYILGDIVFVFGGIGSDSMTQTYPNLYRAADLIENGKDLLGFDFARGYGAVRAISVINIFDWMILFGTKNLAYLMGISQILKIILSFVLFYVYLVLINRKEVVCYIGAASYALCGHMIMRQFWKGYSNEVVLSAFLLIALEYSISKKKRMLLPIALLLYCITMGEYNSIYVFGLVIGYTLFRYFELYDFEFCGLLKLVLYHLFAYILAILGGFIYLFQPLLSSLNSDRAKGGMASFGFRKLFQLQNLDDIKIGFLRTVSAALEGSKELFHPVVHNNILEGATFYCGILVLLFIPFAVQRLKGKRKIFAWITIICAVIYIAFPNVRFIANGFAAYTYKLSSFWITILLLYYGTMGMEDWIGEKNGQQYFSLYALQMFIAIVCLLIVSQEKDKVSFNYQQLVLLIGILALLNIVMVFRNKMKPYNIIYVLSVVSCIDLFSNAYFFAKPEIAQTEDYLNKYYQNVSIDYIKEIENSEFYRIENKDNRSQANAGLVLDYNGFVDYSGGTSMNDNLHHFLEVMNIARIQPSSSHYMTGLSNANALYDILSAKYIITSERAIDNDHGLRMLHEIDGKKIYENTNALPMGFCYQSIIEESELDKLNIQERRLALLDSCVVSSDAVTRLNGIERVESVAYTWDIEGKERAYEYDADLHKIMFTETSSDEVIQLTFDMKARADNFGVLNYGNEEENLGSVLVGSKDTHSSQSFVFTGNNISYFQCQNDMENIKVTAYDREKYYSETDKYLQERKSSEFECTSFSSNNIAGTVKNENDAVLYFSIPYNNGWNIYIDGKKADLLKVNYGFIGAYMEAGEHDIVLQYQIPYIRVSIAVSIIGIVLIIVWCVYWSKREKRRKLNASMNA